MNKYRWLAPVILSLLLLLPACQPEQPPPPTEPPVPPTETIEAPTEIPPTDAPLKQSVVLISWDGSRADMLYDLNATAQQAIEETQ